MSLITIDDDSSESEAMAVDSKSEEETDADRVELNEVASTSSRLAKDTVPLHLDEASCDTTAIEAVERTETEEKPILELMKHLINYNGKQNTTLTNAQLIGILKNEFNIDVSNLHFLTVDIYINVLKKFLKDWPQWDEFDRVMHESRCMNDKEEVEKMLESEYASLKEYLGAMLKACKPFARGAAQSAKRMSETSTTSQTSLEDVTLEVNCTRSQLNTLFFRKPHPEFNNTIFNIETSFPSRINLEKLEFRDIINWSHINVTINMNCFKYKRELMHTYKHTLINKMTYQHTEMDKLNRHLQIAKNTKTGDIVSKADVKAVTEKILRSNWFTLEQIPDVKAIFNTIIEDLNVVSGEIKLLSVFRHYMNPYPYVRYLSQEVDNVESEKYDLQLRETVAPRLKFSLTRCCSKTNAANHEMGWLKLECTFCNLNFIGIEGIEQLKNHFRDVHQDEPDWMCVNCEETFSAMHLASKRWYHACPSSPNLDNVIEQSQSVS